MTDVKKYKMIIIGAGLTGLSTGIAFKKIYPDDSVLILEKNAVVGGCVTTFARGGYRFDTTQLIPDVSNVLEYFDVNVELIKFENYYARLFLVNPSTKEIKRFTVESSQNRFETSLCQLFPEDSLAIQKFFAYCNAIYRELHFLKTEPKLIDLVRILVYCPKILLNSGKTYKELLNRFKFTNTDLYEILCMFSSFSGLSGNRCAALLTSCALVTTLNGSYRPVKGFIQFPNALKNRFEALGGEIRTRVDVKKIITENGIARGVELSSGEKVYADFIVSTADTKSTLGEMVGFDTLQKVNPNYTRKASTVKMSSSAFTVHLGLDNAIDLKTLGFDCGYNVLTTGHKSHEHAFDKWEQNVFELSDNEFHIAAISPSAMIGGKQTLIIRTIPVPSTYWINLRNEKYEIYVEEKKKVAQFLVDKVEKYMVPQLTKHIVCTDIATPATYARYMHSSTGSNYDMMPVPQNFGKNRLKTRTPIKNLFIPKFSHGIWPSLQAGLQVVDMICGGKIMKGNSSYSKR